MVRGQDHAESSERSWELEAGALATLLYIGRSLGSEGEPIEQAAGDYARASIAQSESPRDEDLMRRVDLTVQATIDAILSVETRDRQSELAQGEMLNAFRSIVNARAERTFGAGKQVRSLI